MEVVSTKIERVTFVAQHRCKAPYTEFGFVANGLAVGLARVSELPSIVPGSSITVVLKRKGDWRSILGWLNHSSGEQVVSPMHIHLVFLFFSSLLWWPVATCSESLLDRTMVSLLLVGAQVRLVWGIRARLVTGSILRKAAEQNKEHI